MLSRVEYSRVFQSPTMVQTRDELEQFYSAVDPWGYEHNEHDVRRKAVLLSEIPARAYTNVLDIGCGHGFITRELPGTNIIGVDLSAKAIEQARERDDGRRQYIQGSLFELNRLRETTPALNVKFDLIVITGVLYPQYIGGAKTLVYDIVDTLLASNGILISVHISSWYSSRFPYLLMKNTFYDYREYTHLLEVYVK